LEPMTESEFRKVYTDAVLKISNLIQ